MREPGGLPSMGLHRVGHDWSNLAAAVSKDRSLGYFKLEVTETKNYHRKLRTRSREVKKTWRMRCLEILEEKNFQEEKSQWCQMLLRGQVQWRPRIDLRLALLMRTALEERWEHKPDWNRLQGEWIQRICSQWLQISLKLRCKEKNINGQDEVKTELLLSLLFKMEEVSIYLYVDRKDPVQREKTDNTGKKMKDCQSHVLEQTTGDWIQYTSEGVGLT